MSKPDVATAREIGGVLGGPAPSRSAAATAEGGLGRVAREVLAGPREIALEVAGHPLPRDRQAWQSTPGALMPAECLEPGAVLGLAMLRNFDASGREARCRGGGIEHRSRFAQGKARYWSASPRGGR